MKQLLVILFFIISSIPFSTIAGGREEPLSVQQLIDSAIVYKVNEPQKSIRFLTRALSKSVQTRNDSYTPQINELLGDLYFDNGQYNEALNAYQSTNIRSKKSRGYVKEYEDDKKGKSSTFISSKGSKVSTKYDSIPYKKGLTLYNLKDYNNSVIAFEQGKNAAKQSRYLKGELLNKKGKADALLKLNKESDAITLYQSILKESEKARIFSINRSVNLVLLSLNNTTKEYDSFDDESEEIIEESDYDFNESTTPKRKNERLESKPSYNLKQLNTKANNFKMESSQDEANEIFTQSIIVADEILNNNLTIDVKEKKEVLASKQDALENISQTFADKNNYQFAYSKATELAATKDSLHQIKIKELENKLALAQSLNKAQTQAELLNKDMSLLDKDIEIQGEQMSDRVQFTLSKKYFKFNGLTIRKKLVLTAILGSISILFATWYASKFNRLEIQIGASVVVILIFVFIVNTLAKKITKPLDELYKNVNKLTSGSFPDLLPVETKDEVGQIVNAINELNVNNKKIADFAIEVGKGNYESNVELNTDGDLGNALVTMRNNLLDIADSNKQRNWITEGLAKFADILRGDTKNINEFGQIFISELINYLDINQGGFFVLNDDSEKKEEYYLELIGCYAYNRRKYEEKKILLGEGLVGQCFVEKESIYITEVPDNFVQITSGLGDSNPKAILIVPIKVNDVINGVLELASFNTFKEYEIDFVEKIAENISSTLNSVKVNNRTKMLLEESSELQESMQSQEEELRQNMEELQATQDSLDEKIIAQKQFVKEYETSNHSTIIDAAGRNRMLSQRIGFLAECILNGNESLKEDLKQVVQLHDDTLEVLEKGGVLPGSNIKINACNDAAIGVIKDVNSFWKEYSSHVNIIIDKPLKIDGTINPEVANALIYIEQNTSTLLEKNKALVGEFVKESNDAEQKIMNLLG